MALMRRIREKVWDQVSRRASRPVQYDRAVEAGIRILSSRSGAKAFSKSKKPSSVFTGYIRNIEHEEFRAEAKQHDVNRLADEMYDASEVSPYGNPEDILIEQQAHETKLALAKEIVQAARSLLRGKGETFFRFWLRVYAAGEGIDDARKAVGLNMTYHAAKKAIERFTKDLRNKFKTRISLR
jgi:hypothetical protein